MAAAVQVASASDAPRPACDISSLNLEVASAVVVDAVRSVNGTATPEAGKKIVVVHLKAGNPPPSACEWLSNLMDFEAVYQVPAGPKEIPYNIAPASAIKLVELIGGTAYWSFLDPHHAGGVVRLQDVGSMDVAFMLPKDVMAFTVRVPSSVKGRASLAPGK